MDDRPYLRILRDQITIDTLRATFGEGWYVFRTDEVWCARAVPSGTPRTPRCGLRPRSRSRRLRQLLAPQG
jgi:hypothetical protein